MGLLYIRLLYIVILIYLTKVVKKVKTDLSLIINSITSPVLVGIPIRSEDNSITDFKIAFTNSQFKQKAGDIIKEDGLWSEVDEHFSKECTILRYEERMEISLENADDYRLYMIVPLTGGFGVIGRTDKYISPAAVLYADQDRIILKENGPCAYIRDGKLTEM